MRGKIIASGRYEEDNRPIYWMTKNYKYGTFNATAAPAEEDRDIANDWEGYIFCEYKCDLQALHQKAKNYYERYIESERIWKALRENPNCNDGILDKLLHQCDVAWIEYQTILAEYREMKANYKVFVSNRLKIRREANEKIADYRAREIIDVEAEETTEEN